MVVSGIIVMDPFSSFNGIAFFVVFLTLIFAGPLSKLVETFPDTFFSYVTITACTFAEAVAVDGFKITIPVVKKEPEKQKR